MRLYVDLSFTLIYFNMYLIKRASSSNVKKENGHRLPRGKTAHALARSLGSSSQSPLSTHTCRGCFCSQRALSTCTPASPCALRAHKAPCLLRTRATRVRAVQEGHSRIFGRCSELRGGAPVPCSGLAFFGGESSSATLFERKLNELDHPPPVAPTGDGGGRSLLLEVAAAAAPARGTTRRTSFWRHSCERLASLCTASRNSSGTPGEG